MAWLRVFAIGIFGIIPAKLLALVVVPFLSGYDRLYHPVFGCRDATDLSWYNVGFRNGAHNFLDKGRVLYTQKGNKLAHADWTLEKLPGFQLRSRRSLDGKYVSFRMTWGEPRSDKGKREFYIGWTMSEEPTFGLSFVQLRVF